MKRHHAANTAGNLVRPPGWANKSTSNEDPVREDEEDASPPAKKILRKLLENEVQRAIRELNEDPGIITQPKGHRAASLISEFDPDSEDCTTVTAWLKKIDQIGEINGWSETTKAFHLQDKLRGQARKWYNRLDEYDYSWTDWKQMLTRAFPRHRDYGNMLDEMMNRKKLPTESMTKYYQEKVAMCFRCKLTDSATVSCIIRGLPSSLQANARAFQCERPEELYEGFLCALDDYQPPSIGLRPSSKDFSVGNARQGNDKKKIIFDPEVDPCPRCKKTGHLLRNCPLPDTRTCFKCGKPGHIATRCTSASTPASSTKASMRAEDNVMDIKILQNYSSVYEKVGKVNGIYVKSYIDTGSQVNVLSSHVAKLLNLEINPTDTVLKGFSGDHLSSVGEVAFLLELDGISIHCKAHLTDVDMGGINLLVGQPIINSDGMSLIVCNGAATLKQDTDFTKQIDVIESPSRFKVVTTSKECLLPGCSIVRVNVLGNDEANDVVTTPQHFELRDISYAIPATLLRGAIGYIKVINSGTKSISWARGDVLTRAESCTASPPPVDIQSLHTKAICSGGVCYIQEGTREGRGLDVTERASALRRYSKQHGRPERDRRKESDDSGSDSDTECKGFDRSEFWRRKMRTVHNILDVDKDGLISYADFLLFAERFKALGHLDQSQTKEFTDIIRLTWEEQWGAVDPYNFVTVEQYLEDMNHVLNDKTLKKKALRWLPYLFKAVDSDRSGFISVVEWKLFYECLGLSAEHAAVSFAVIDINGDGKLSLKEFVRLGKDFFFTEDETRVSKMFWGPLIQI